MEHIDFPGDFPSFETMMSVLKKVFEKSWKVDLDIEDINLWLDNFTGTFFDTEDERRLALWMLCNFTYYNDAEINHLCSVLFKKFIHTLMTDYGLKSSEEVETRINTLKFTSIGAQVKVEASFYTIFVRRPDLAQTASYSRHLSLQRNLTLLFA